ncbi:MAG: DUF2510 domain-containing protein [Propionibacterium sp.]|nr:DUF2510 domain-containing protein [Propionibacterium sp.]
MTQTPQQPPAGWYPDPAGGNGERFWDGGAWSQSTRDPKPEPVHPADPGPARQTSAPPAPGHEPRPPSPHGSGPQPQHPYAQHGPDPRLQMYGGKQIPVQGKYALAGFWRRVLGYIADWLLMTLLAMLLVGDLQTRVSTAMSNYLAQQLGTMIDPAIPPPTIPGALFADVAILAVVGVLLVAGYRVITVGLLNATLGQKLVGIRVARLGDEELGDVGWRAAILRGVFAGLLYETIGVIAQISVLFTDRKQTVPDLLSKTVVVNTREAVQ